jgi:cell division protein FtsB
MADRSAQGAAKRTQSTGQPGQPGRGRRVLRAVLWIGAALLLVESLFGERGFTAMIEARRQQQALQTSLDRLRAENARLRAEARRLREDPTAIEEVARRDLRLIAPGEKLFIIKDAKPAK